jgi:hypothetical protein
VSGPAYGIFRIEGQAYLSLETVAQCYECEVAWLREAWLHGLFGRGIEYEGHLLLHVAVMDRVADVLRLGRHQGLSFESIVVLLAGEPAEAFLAAVVVNE